jgi:uncharacterized protein (TIGR03435 family)
MGTKGLTPTPSGEYSEMNTRIWRAVSASILASAIGFGPVSAQSPDGSRPRFAVVSVKPNKTGGPLTFGVQGGRFVATNIPIKLLIQRAYSTPSRGLLPEQIVGSVPWMDSDRFDIEAKPDGDMRTMSPDQLVAMIRALLDDRFRLTTHRETRELPLFNLVAGKNGPKLKPSASQLPPTRPTQSANASMSGPPPRGTTRIVPTSSGNQTMLTLAGTAVPVSDPNTDLPLPMLVNLVQSYAGRPVQDKTGLKGLYDFQLQFVPDTLSAGTDSGPSLFTALEEQLGLKLEPGRGPVEVLVVDRIQKPSEN